MGETSFSRWQVRQLTRLTIMPPAWPGDRLAADPLEHLDLLLVVVGVAAGAVRGGVHEPLLVERVLDAEMASQAVDGVLGHVLVVHEAWSLIRARSLSRLWQTGQRSRGTSPLPRITSTWQLMQSTPFS